MSYHFEKQILVVGMDNRRFVLFTVPSLKIIKIVKPKGKLLKYRFHTDIPICAELHHTKKTRAIRIYDPIAE